MLSIPLIPPQDDSSTFLRATYRPRAESPPPAVGQSQQQTHRQRQQRDEEKKQHNARSPLAVLKSEEATIESRKAAVRNFGSHWIRPPGISKTLQAMIEEALEREEQAEIERQEAGMRDMQAQQQLAEAQQQAQETAQNEGEDGEEERDLDADIPDADATTADVTFNEDSMMEGSQIEITDRNIEDENGNENEMEVAELTGAAQDEEELGIELERDLDDSVPEAGSYQHTDTEVEDSDSDSELRSSFVDRGAPRSALSNATPAGQMGPPARTAGGLQERMQAQVHAVDALPRSPGSLNLSSSILDSSLVGSSPVVQRTNGGARGRGGRSRRGRHS
ncbi:hypothetical protein DOTSEDRAFT_70041 [Dothistroma septosporum NZE10]|uniref:Uncharacterized protein n=1 Tax=Dothistroma septosporum (strain NZE10 / CBS 128990) TaxID=675120 RepID=N1Q1E6_DOTSN|nr:hypothetical protein DOTSEDRAFT_70041 [Dothistroma septosporum NZE10]